MDFESAVSVLRATCGRPPAQAVRVAVAHAQQLSPLVVACLERGASGEMLTWREENLVFAGLHALAEARRTEVFGPLLRFLASDPKGVRGAFDEDFMWLRGLLLALADDDAGALFALAGDDTVLEEVRSAALEAAAVLVLDGRADRDAFIPVLDGFDRAPAAVQDGYVWFAWAYAIAALRLREFVPRVRQAWDDGHLYGWRDVDWSGWVELFDQAEPFRPVEPVTDAVKCLACFAEPPEAEGFRVPVYQLGWLDRVLQRCKPEAGCLELLDGRMTAALCGPAPRPDVDTVIPEAWTEGLTRREVRDEARRLLRARFAEIEDRLRSGVAPDPFLRDTPPGSQGALWASAFLRWMTGASLQWAPLARHTARSALLVLLLGLLETRGEAARARRELCEGLGPLALAIRRFWTHGPPHWAISAMEAGRNDPCPCGSGRKFKKCCAAVERRVAEPVG